jgi:predicted PurR-regulated permease PerM
VSEAPPAARTGPTIMIDTSGWSYLKRLFSRKVVLWASFITVLYLLRDFFALFLFTFVLSYLAATVVDRLTQLVPRRRLVVCVVFLFFVAVITALCIVIIPAVISEVRGLITDVDQRQLIEKSTKSLQGFLSRISTRFEAESIEQTIREGMPNITRAVFSTISAVFTGLVFPVLYFLLAMLLAFFMVLDLPNIRDQIHKLEHSRLRDYYLDVYPGVIAFFSLLGNALEAQTVIALVNTCMTAIGLAVLGVPNIAMLSVIVFVASYIPVLGMWLSTIPMVIVAIPAGGPQLALQVVIVVCVVHILEAYVINPRIYGAHMEVHPLMVLIILIVGEHVFGLWGLVLGVPIWTYVWRYGILGTTDEYWMHSAGVAMTPEHAERALQEAAAAHRPAETRVVIETQP